MNTRGVTFDINTCLKNISRQLTESHETLAVSESVTAGTLQAFLSSADQATTFYQGGITAYNLTQKVKHLGVDPIKALSNNCVSEDIAAQMSRATCKLFSSDWGIGITGYSTAIPEMGINTLFAFYAFAYKGDVVFSNLLISANAKKSQDVQHYYATHLLDSFSRFLQEQAATAKKPAVHQ